MKKCAYCGRTDEKLTKEHVVNKSFIDRFHKNGTGYANVYKKYTENYLTTKDVCSKCNNEILGELDYYFLDFYETNIPTTIIDDTSTIEIIYDFDKLSKWLLKTLYNSERKNAYENLPKKMHIFKNYIIGKDGSKITFFKIFIELLRDIPKEEILKHSQTSEEQIPEKLNFLRIGNLVFHNQLKSGIVDSIKHITTSNFMFHIFILDVGKETDDIFNFTLDTYKRFSTTKLFYLDPLSHSFKITASNRTIIDILENTFEGDKHVTERMGE